MTDLRMTCVVPGCRRTRGRHKGEPPIEPGMEWICGPHWKLVPRRIKAIRQRAARRAKRLGTHNSYMALNRLWRRCVMAAIERAAGI